MTRARDITDFMEWIRKIMEKFNGF